MKGFRVKTDFFLFCVCILKAGSSKWSSYKKKINKKIPEEQEMEDVQHSQVTDDVLGKICYH